MRKLGILFVVIILLASCKKEDEATLCTGAECNYTLSSGQTAGSLPSALNDEYNLAVDFASPGSPYTLGTNGKFTLDGDVLTVEIDGEACITLRNPYQSSPSEITFVDDCRDNLIYSISENSQGSLNEVNVGSLSMAFLCQFK